MTVHSCSNHKKNGSPIERILNPSKRIEEPFCYDLGFYSRLGSARKSTEGFCARVWVSETNRHSASCLAKISTRPRLSPQQVVTDVVHSRKCSSMMLEAPDGSGDASRHALLRVLLASRISNLHVLLSLVLERSQCTRASYPQSTNVTATVRGAPRGLYTRSKCYFIRPSLVRSVTVQYGCKIVSKPIDTLNG